MQKASVVAKGAAIIAAGTLCSRLLGLVRERMISNAFGTTIAAGAFRTAFSVPDLLYYLLAGGALSAVFIPVFSDYLSRGEQKDANRIGSSIANLTVLVLMAGVILEIIFAPYVVRLVGHGYTPGTPLFTLAVNLTRVMCGVVIFTAITGLLSGMLNSYYHFLMPTVVWNVYNLFFIFGIMFLRKLNFHGTPLGIYGVAIGVVMGAIAMALLQIPHVIKYGFRYHPIIDFKHAGVQQVLRSFVPVMFGLSLSFLNLQFIPMSIASLTPALSGSSLAQVDAVKAAAVAVIYAANRIVLLPMGIFAVAVATAAFPQMSQLASAGDLPELRSTVARNLKAILLLVIPSAVGIIVLAKPMIALLNGGGKFDMQDINTAAFALTLFTWGLLGLSLLQLINRAFFSLKDVITPVIVGILMVGSNIVLGWLVTVHTTVRYGGTALATSLTTTLAALVLIELLRRRLRGFGGRDLLVTFIKIGVASAVMGAVAYFVAAFLAPSVSYEGVRHSINPAVSFSVTAPVIEKVSALGHASLKLPLKHLLLQIAASMTAGIVAYLVMLRLLGVQELTMITDRIAGRFRRKPAATI